MKRLSLIIPCYNEAKNLPLLVERCARLTASADVEVVLVDNGSADDSSQVLAQLLASHADIRSVRVPVNRGYGHGILAGLATATSEILAWTHADLQTDPLDLLEGLKLFDEHGTHGFVKGKRYGRPAGDRLFTYGMNVFETVLLGKLLYDVNAQPTMFPRAFFLQWRNPPDDFSVDLYAYYLARRNDLPVHRFAVRFGERAHGVSHWNVNWAGKWKFIRRTVDYSFKLKRELARQPQ